MARGPLNQQEVEQYRQDGVVLCRLAGSRQGQQRLEPPFGGAGFSLSIRAKPGLCFRSPPFFSALLSAFSASLR